MFRPRGKGGRIVRRLLPERRQEAVDAEIGKTWDSIRLGIADPRPVDGFIKLRKPTDALFGFRRPEVSIGMRRLVRFGGLIDYRAANSQHDGTSGQQQCNTAAQFTRKLGQVHSGALTRGFEFCKMRGAEWRSQDQDGKRHCKGGIRCTVGERVRLVWVPVARLLDRHTVLAGSTLKGAEFAARDTVKGKAQRSI